MLRLLKFLITGYWSKPALLEAPKTKRCTGFNSLIGDVQTCTGHGSPLCWSGRCRYHCGTLCKCEKEGLTEEEARTVRRMREERKDLTDAIVEAQG